MTQTSYAPSQGRKKSLAEIAQITNFGKTMLFRIKNCVRNNDETTLRNLLSPSTSKPGVSTVLTEEENDKVPECLIFAAKRGFAVGKDTLKSILAQIASDGRPSWKNRTPCDAEIRYFRVRHRELAFWNSEDKDNAKFKGESYSHVDGFFKVLRDVEINNPGIISDDDRI